LYRADPQTPPLELANALRPLALLKHDAGEFAAAERSWEEAKNLYSSVNVYAGVAESAGCLALIARHREDPERARRMLAEASAAAESSGDYNSVRYVNESANLDFRLAAGSNRNSADCLDHRPRQEQHSVLC
jgi:hypothetical protein